MKLFVRGTALAVGACVLSVLAGCGGGGSGGGSASAASPSINLGLVQAQDFVHAMPALVAEQQGFFTSRGLTVTINGFTSGSDLTKAMVGGSIDVGAATGLDAVSGAAKNVGLQAFYGVLAQSPMALVAPANSPITGFKDLGGKKVGISAKGSLTDFTTRAAVTKAGVNPTDVTEVPLGAPSSTISALDRGDIDAFVLPVNFGYMESATGKGHIVQTAADVLGNDSQFAVLMAMKPYISGNTANLNKLAGAYQDALTWMQGHRTETVQLAVDKLSMTQPIAEQTFDALASSFTPDGTINTAGMTAFATALPELGIATTAPAQDSYLSTSVKPGK